MCNIEAPIAFEWKVTPPEQTKKLNVACAIVQEQQ